MSFPCTKECPSNVQWVIRLKLIEAHSGDLIFQVRLQHKLDEDEKTAEAYNELAAKLTTKVVDEFSSGFIVPWHRWRFEHLKPKCHATPKSAQNVTFYALKRNAKREKR